MTALSACSLPSTSCPVGYLLHWAIFSSSVGNHQTTPAATQHGSPRSPLPPPQLASLPLGPHQLTRIFSSHHTPSGRLWPPEGVTVRNSPYKDCKARKTQQNTENTFKKER